MLAPIVLSLLVLAGFVQGLPGPVADGDISGRDSGDCSPAHRGIRQEWRSLSLHQRKDYINAVLCLQSKPPRISHSFAPGVRSRFDDFVAVHINQTQVIHYNGYFLGWHRYFTWLYEKALREECGYQGYAPYWNWALDWQDPTKSPIWSGDEYSLSGDGAVDPNNNGTILGAPPNELYLPPGAGGGCVYSGPFKNMSVNLGPADLGNDAPGPVAALNYNPRCLKRDINAWVSQKWLKPSLIASLINDNNNIIDFQNVMQGVGVDFAGVHGGGHFTFGGDPGKDLYVSPGDPSFYLHHGQIDHVWWQWQEKDPNTRTHEIGGTQTFLNNPPSANVTLTDVLDLSPLGPPVQLGQLLSTTRNQFCYTYI